MDNKNPIIENGEYLIKQIEGDNNIPQRLLDMGVLPGSHFTIIRKGPVGKTVELAIEETGIIAVRTSELQHLKFELIAAPLSSYDSLEKIKLRIREFRGGHKFMQKMVDRNLKIGTEITKIEKNHGFIVTTFDNEKIHIGRGEASKIILEAA